MNKKYSNLLTILLVVIIIAIVAIVGFLGYKYYETYIIKSSSEDFVDNFGDSTQNGKNNTTTQDEDKTDEDNSAFDGVNDGNTSDSSNSSDSVKKYNGYVTAGTIEIPTTKLKAPVLDQSEYSTKALETSVVVLYGVGLNKPGNTTIAGHNYRRSGVFFSDNKKINVGDKIYITDLSGKRLAYTVYDKFEADENDADYMSRDTQGATEISLTTCTDDSKARLIILARAEG